MAVTPSIGKKQISNRGKKPSLPIGDFSLWADFVRSINRSTNLNRTLQNIVKEVSLLFSKEGCLIHLLNPRKDLLEVAKSLGAEQGFTQPLKPGMGIPGVAFYGQKPVVVSGVDENSWGLWKEAARKEGILSALSLPLRGRKTTLGTFTLLSKRVRKYGTKDIPFYNVMADHVALAIENAHLNEKAQEQLKTLAKERKREKQIKTFLENIVDRSVDPIMATDLHGRFTFVSQGAEEMFGRPKEELLGKKISVFYAGGEREAKKIMKTLARQEKLRNYETEFIGRNEKAPI